MWKNLSLEPGDLCYRSKRHRDQHTGAIFGSLVQGDLVVPTTRTSPIIRGGFKRHFIFLRLEVHSRSGPATSSAGPIAG